jgi:putative copper resistance protein D
VAAGRRHAFVRFASVEVGVMVAAAGLAVVLARTAPPVGALTRAAPPHADTFPTVDRNIDPVGVRGLLLGFRPDVLVLTAAVVALLVYALMVRRVLRTGGGWPARRTAAFTGGVLVAVWALCGGLGSYSGALFSAEVARLLTLALVVPALLTAGAPVRLARRVDGGAHRAWRWLDPTNGLVALVLVLGAGLMTPLLEASVRSPALHVALGVAVLVAGLLFWWPLLRIDVAPYRRGRAGDEGVLVGVLALLVLVYAGHIWTSSTLFAGRWFAQLDWWWSNAYVDQRHAAVVVTGFGLLVLVVAVVLGRRAPGRVGS